MNTTPSSPSISDPYCVPTVYSSIQKKPEPPILTVSVPGSKSITNRALLLATLAKGTSFLRGALFSDDSRYFLQCIQDLGFSVSVSEPEKAVQVTGLGGAVPKKEASIYVGSAGTAARFLTAYLGVAGGRFHLDSSDQMKKRPMAPLLSTLERLGTRIDYDGEPGFFPFTLTSSGPGQSVMHVNIDHSSQFLSALLIASCCFPDDVTIHVEGTHGMSYIAITTRMMADFGITVRQTAPDTFFIPGGQSYHPLDYQIEPDVSAACYFYAMAVLLGISVTVRHVTPDSIQGDMAFLSLLKQMGAVLTDSPDGITVTGPKHGIYPGITCDMHACSDQAITLAALAVFAQTPTTITGIGHIRYQESDRIHAICTELGRMRIRFEETEDSITIHPGAPVPSLVRTYDDHRMAMGFSLIGLRAEGIRIDDPGCCRKTFREYFSVLDDALSRL
ncbi:MAG TPA: 3-phosphoshikimate 1-carboxyvinyltransferase [Candidatus Fimimorpha excrementavium]|nr:3-phosphoshikimate 1-carboxyvinyltransferase [Candidatus Fimimorpha excrementavium]